MADEGDTPQAVEAEDTVNEGDILAAVESVKADVENFLTAYVAKLKKSPPVIFAAMGQPSLEIACPTFDLVLFRNDGKNAIKAALKDCPFSSKEQSTKVRSFLRISGAYYQVAHICRGYYST
jgi:hypothetical protein